jgi:glycosyltransferase involved in cell wall biosynthesis
VLPLYRRATVVCLPCVVVATGDRDGLPTSLLEAMALGAPVVSTAVGGIGELVLHEETGLTVPERDPAALADALERLLADPELAAALADRARAHVEQRFSLERSVSGLRALFAEVGA